MAKWVILPKNEDYSFTGNYLEYDGIGLTEINVIPHIDSMSGEEIRAIAEASTIKAIIGLPDNSFVESVNTKLKFSKLWSI